MQPFHETAMELTGKLKEARLQAATLSKNLTETEYHLKASFLRDRLTVTLAAMKAGEAAE
ncbi:MAG: hypothetical protein SWC96_13910 [Thermodesulfobacteriota bacterium]|nr:hypothetical protein [Thermodesulfobacteriota bacterium]